MAQVYAARLGSAPIKAVAVKLADYANDAGGNIWPALETVADQTEVSKSTVQRAIRELIELDVLEIEREGGKGPGNTTRYRFKLTNLAVMPRVSTDSQGSQGGQGDHLKDSHGDHLNGKKVVTHAGKDSHGDHQSIKKNHQKKKKGADAPAASDFHPILEDWEFPEDWRAWALKESPEHADMLEAEARKFKRYWREQAAAKTAAEWFVSWQRWWDRTISRPPEEPRAVAHSGRKGVKDWNSGATVHDNHEPFKVYAARMKAEGKWRVSA